MAFGPVFLRTFSPTFDRRNTVSNGLLNALIAYWPLNENSGDASDLHTNSLTLTQDNSPTSDTGLVYAKARKYLYTIPTEPQGHYRDSEALLNAGDVDITLSGWFYLNSKSTNMYLAGKYFGAATRRGYQIDYDLVSDRLRFVVRDTADTTTTVVSANNLGSVSTGTWYFIVAWHDSVNNLTGIQVNNGTADTASTSGGVLSNSEPFMISRTNTASLVGYIGLAGPIMLWKSAAGGGGVLTAAQKTALYNGGAGLTYAAFTT